MAKKANGAFGEFPFANGEFTKMWSEFKVPMVDVDALVAAQRKNFETMTAANQMAAEGFQTLAKRQAEIVQETFASMQKAAQELAAIPAVNDRVAKQSEMTKTAFATALANLKELQDLAAKSTGETFEIVNKRFVEGLDEVTSAAQAYKN